MKRISDSILDKWIKSGYSEPDFSVLLDLKEIREAAKELLEKLDNFSGPNAVWRNEQDILRFNLIDGPTRGAFQDPIEDKTPQEAKVSDIAVPPDEPHIHCGCYWGKPEPGVPESEGLGKCCECGKVRPTK